jgi:hypothetical protein
MSGSILLLTFFQSRTYRYLFLLAASLYSRNSAFATSFEVYEGTTVLAVGAAPVVSLGVSVGSSIKSSCPCCCHSVFPDAVSVSHGSEHHLLDNIIRKTDELQPPLQTGAVPVAIQLPLLVY